MLAPIPVISVSRRNRRFRIPLSWTTNRRGGRSRTPLAVGILLLIALIPFALFRGSQVPEAEAAWWNPSWHYRQQVDVTNNTAEQNNVYISVSLDTSDISKFQADCGDLRFTRQNGQLLPYYVASGCGTASTSVHVQLDTFPAGAQTFYAYYGNSSASDGFSSADFLMAASSYTVGGVGSEEIGPGPIANWKFDEGSGVTANDSAGGNTSTIAGATWVNEDQCVSGKCLSFDGSSSLVNIYSPAFANSFRSDEGTITLWAKANTSDVWNDNTLRRLILIRTDINNYVTLYKQADNSLSGIYRANGVSKSVSFGQTPSDFFLITITWSQSVDQMKVYFNGIQQGSTQIGLEDWVGNLSANSNLIGANYITPAYVWNGLIDEVKIFPYALTEDQIKTEYNLGAATIIGTGPTAPQPAGGTLTDSLVAHWAFDEQYGQTVHDKAGNNHGTFGADTNPGSDDPAWTAAGECKVNGCLGFDGASDYVGSTATSLLNVGTGDFTLSVWVYTEGSSNQSIFNKGSTSSPCDTSGSKGYQLRLLNGAPSVRLNTGSTQGCFVLISDSALSANAWHHVTAVIDRNSNATLYIDGAVSKVGDVSSYSNSLDGANAFQIGLIGISIFPFNGLIDEVKIYNTALTPEQVLVDMNAGASVAYSVGSEEADELIDGAGAPPIAEWKFDEKRGTVAYDSSGNGNDGTVNGATWKSGCKQGACLEFDGNSSYVDVYGSNLSSVFSGGKGTLTAWAKVSDPGVWEDSTTRYIVKLGANSNNQLFLAKSSASNTLTSWYRAGGITEAVSVNSVSTNDYFQVSLTWDSTADGGNGEYKFYVNGGQVGSTQAIEGTWTGELSPNLNVMGTSSTTPSGTWKGRIDHVLIYDYARTPAQIAYDYNRGKPVAHWRFDECEGEIIHDSSGNNYHGTLKIGTEEPQSETGTCSTVNSAWGNGTGGRFGAAMSFDGVDDYVNAGNHSAFNIVPTPGSSGSISFWIKSTDRNKSIIDSKGGGSNNAGYDMRISSSNTIQLRVANGSGQQSTLSDTLINNGEWRHVVGIIDRPNSQFLIYIDGKLDKQYPLTLAGDFTPSRDLRIGAYADSALSGNLNGEIDDVRIYNYALSPAQIMKVYNQGYGVRYGN